MQVGPTTPSPYRLHLEIAAVTLYEFQRQRKADLAPWDELTPREKQRALSAVLIGAQSMDRVRKVWR